ncbi:MAG: DnaJ family molecular chaperone [Rhodospirillaceae bacterium]
MKWRELNSNAGQRFSKMQRSDPYALFNVARGVDLAEIKRVYRGMVKTYHPDHADPFMRPYCMEILKIINRAMAHIEAEYRDGLAG